MSNSFQSTRPVGRLLWEELLQGVILHITLLLFFLAFKGQVHEFAGRVNIVNHSKDKCNIEIFLSSGDFFNAIYSRICHHL